MLEKYTNQGIIYAPTGGVQPTKTFRTPSHDQPPTEGVYYTNDLRGKRRERAEGQGGKRGKGRDPKSWFTPPPPYSKSWKIS